MSGEFVASRLGPAYGCEKNVKINVNFVAINLYIYMCVCVCVCVCDII